MTEQERNMRFMQIAMKYLPEGKTILDQKGIELDLNDLQPMLDLLVKVMTEAYELGKETAQGNK